MLGARALCKNFTLENVDRQPTVIELTYRVMEEGAGCIPGGPGALRTLAFAAVFLALVGGRCWRRRLFVFLRHPTCMPHSACSGGRRQGAWREPTAARGVPRGQCGSGAGMAERPEGRQCGAADADHLAAAHTRVLCKPQGEPCSQSMLWVAASRHCHSHGLTHVAIVIVAEWSSHGALPAAERG